MAEGNFLPWNQETLPEFPRDEYWAMDLSKWLTFAQILGIFVGVAAFLLPWHRLTRKQSLEESTMPASNSNIPVDVEANVPAQKPTRKRLFYLDTLKAFLMVLVIMQHTSEQFAGGNGADMINVYACKDVYANLHNMTKADAAKSCSIPGGPYIFPMVQCWFMDMNETYFMELFFFLSGFFNPSSFDQKGLQVFLSDKFKRLGIPSVAWFFFMGPFFRFCTVRLVAGLSFTYGASGSWLWGGAPWFIAWLTTFNVVYAFVDKTPVKVDLPNIAILLLAGSIMGVFILLTAGKKTGTVFNTPNNISEIIPCALAFSCGSLAKRNGWLDQLEMIPGRSIWFLRALLVLYAGSRGFYFILLQIVILKDLPIQYPEDQLTIFRGMMLLITPIVLIDFFRRFLNCGGRFAAIMSEATFLVYIIHPYVFEPVVWSYVAWIRASGAMVVRTMLSPEAFQGAYSFAFAVQSDSDVFLVLGWLYTFLVGNVLVWPLAHFLRKLPGLREVF